jgi:Leucine-rich repeat (LRR) protein
LHTLFQATDGINWNWNWIRGAKWNFTDASENNPCDDAWQGIECTYNAHRECHVSRLKLADTSLRNELPDNWTNLSYLRTLDLSANHLNGSFPLSLGQLPNLIEVHLSHNHLHSRLPFQNPLAWPSLELFQVDFNGFSGSFPNDLAHISTLRTLIVSSNKLEGNFSPVLCKLHELEELDIRNNSRLTGKLPHCIREMTGLRYLKLSDNHFIGELPPDIGLLPNLTEFSAGDNLFEGHIPASFHSLLNLEILNLARNFVNGTLSSDLLLLPTLKVLRLERNLLRGELPCNFKKHATSNIEVVTLNDNLFHGPLPATWAGVFPSLISLYLTANALHGNLSSVNFSLWNRLEKLGLGENLFTGPIPSKLFQLPKLRVLYLNFNLLDGSLPRNINQTSRLDTLYLASNFLEGPIPPSFENFHDLFDLSLADNRLTGTIPAFLGNFRRLNNLLLGFNHFNGSIPSELFGSQSINFLHVAANSLTGNISFKAGQTFSIKSIYLEENHLTGNINFLDTNQHIIPIGGDSLYSVNFQRNLFSGPIPELQASRLYVLQLQHNCFTGRISLTHVPKLANLDVSSNLLVGSIPWQQIPPTIVLMNFSSNAFTGTLPDSDISWGDLKAIDISNNHIGGSIGTFFNKMPKLLYLYVSGNRLNGNLASFLTTERSTILIDDETDDNVDDDFFPDIKHPIIANGIEILELSNNEFTGSLPNHVFTFPTLRTFIASVNCFEGTLPSTICQAVNMTTLVLDGMGSSPACNAPIFGALAGHRGAYLSNRGSGKSSQPWIDCLLTQGNKLEILHLSGLGIHASLPSHLQTLPPKLHQLSLSNNYMTGTIPSIFFEHGKWTELDLSFNQFVGLLQEIVWENEVSFLSDFFRTSRRHVSSYNFTISDDLITEFPSSRFAHNISLHFTGVLRLEINRLSGSIPQSYFNMSDMNILEGNMFDCRVTMQRTVHGRYHLVSELPAKDPWAASYDCGSRNVNVVLYLWLAAVGFLLLVCLGIVLYQNQGCLCHLQEIGISPIWINSLPSVVIGVYQTVLFLLSDSVSTQSIWVNNLVDSISMFHSIEQDEKQQDNFVFIAQLITSFRRFVTSLRRWIQHYFRLFGFAVVIILPCYLLVKESNQAYVTYHNQYIWTVSACFLRGIVPMLVCTFLIVYVLIHYLLQMDTDRKKTRESESDANSESRPRSSRVQSFQLSSVRLSRTSENSAASETGSTSSDRWSSFLYHSLKKHWQNVRLRLWVSVWVCISLIFLVNGLYVYALQQNITSIQKVLLSLGLSIVKIVSNGLFTWMFTSHVFLSALVATISSKNNDSLNLQGDVNGAKDSDQKNNWSHLSITYLLIAILCFNNVLVPYLVEALISTDCFYYATLTYPPIVSSTVPLQVCRLILDPAVTRDYGRLDASLVSDPYFPVCFVVERTVEYYPPYTYSYTCSSSLVTTFALVFLLRYIWSGVVRPVSEVLSYRRYAARLRDSRGNPLMMTTTDTSWDAVCLPYPWKFVLYLETIMTLLQEPSPTDPALQIAQQSHLRHLYQGFLRLRDANHQNCGFDHRRMVSPLVADWLFFLTFGIVLPPMAVVVFVSVLVHVLPYLYWTRRVMLLQLQRSTAVSSVKQKELLDMVVGVENPMHASNGAASEAREWRDRDASADVLHAKVERNVDVILSQIARQLMQEWEYCRISLFQSTPYIAVVVALFWAFSLFDTLGAAIGSKRASIVFILLPLFPVILIGIQRINCSADIGKCTNNLSTLSIVSLSPRMTTDSAATNSTVEMMERTTVYDA